MKIYLAGPLFSAAEQEFNTKLGGLLRAAGHEVWIPQDIEQRDKTAKEVFAKDVEGIDWADVVVANMDGADPDSGTAWECGYAYQKKPVIVFRTDFRAGDEPGKALFNLMLAHSATVLLDARYSSTEGVAARISKALQTLNVSQTSGQTVVEYR